MDVMGRMNRIGREANSAEWTTRSLKVELQDETAPLLVDPNGVLPRSCALECLKAVAW